MPNKYNLLSAVPPAMPPKLPKFIKKAIDPVPDLMKPAAANGIFSPSSALMSHTYFEYLDGVLHEPTFMSGVVAASSIGKGYLDSLYEVVVEPLREHDRESRRKLNDYAIKCRRNQDGEHPDRPTDAAILLPEPDMSNPALVQMLMDAENEGDKALYTNIPEVDLMDQTCGGHRKVQNVIRLNFDVKRYGQERATTNGISGNPKLRWRFNFSTTPGRAQKFFKDGLLDGTLGRINVSYVPRPAGAKRGFPQQGKYDDKYKSVLKEYLERLTHAEGVIRVPRINVLIERLADEMADITDLSEDDTFQSLSNRSLVIAWLKGCLLYIAEGYRWSNQISDFVEWSLYYDLWSKIALFAPQWSKQSQATLVDVRKYGPANMLDMLPASFSRVQLEKQRELLGKTTDCTPQLCTWQNRGFITYDASTQLYTKTAEYLAKHPQQNP